MVLRFWIVFLAVLLGGCRDFLAERMVMPPNGMAASQATFPQLGDNGVRIRVGPPDASLAAWVREPTEASRGTILLLHGFINDHNQLSSAAKALNAAGYRTVQVDLRGHGQSTGEHLTFGVDDARDLMQVTDYLQAHHLCGSTLGVYGVSYGAATAILFAGTDPRVTAVVAVAPFSSLREEAPYFGRHILPVPGLFLSLIAHYPD